MALGPWLRRLGLPLALAALGVGLALLVGRWPADPERTVVTRRAHGADPLLSASILRFQVASLLGAPSRFYRPPFLHPDANPLRGTEPLLSEALVAAPLRLALGDRPAPLFTLVKLLTLALVTLFTGLLLRELGVRPSLCLAAGALVVAAGTTVVFIDRLQALSLQWLPLAALFAARTLRRRSPADALLFAASAFLLVQASLYTAVMLLVAAPFVLAAAWGQRRALAGRGGVLLLLAAAASAALSGLVLWPYARQRADIAAHASTTFLEVKSWSPARLADFATALPEYPRWPLGPAADWDGLFPGTALLLYAAAVAAFAARGSERRSAQAGSRWSRHAFAAFAAALVLLVGWSLFFQPTPLSRALAQACLLGALVTWAVRLARWPAVKDREAARALVASVGLAAALALALVACGSPIEVREGSAPLLDGAFAPLARLLPPLRELRELKRCVLPAGWFAVVAGTLVLESRLPRRGRAGAVLAALVLVVAAAERLDADTRKASVAEVPQAYALLQQARGTRGLLELPFDEWGRIDSVHRMLWQPVHGRPIVAGRTGIAPGWYGPARAVFDECPSEECVRLLRSWDVDTVMDTRDVAAARAEGLLLRAGLAAPAGRRQDATWRVLDVLPGPTLPAEAEPGPGEWHTPAAADPITAPALDGSVETAAELAEGAAIEVMLAPDAVVGALELRYRAPFVYAPRELRALALHDGEWREVPLRHASFLRARTADQLLRRQDARLVVGTALAGASRLRLLSGGEPWQLPELRLRLQRAPKPAAVS